MFTRILIALTLLASLGVADSFAGVIYADAGELSADAVSLALASDSDQEPAVVDQTDESGFSGFSSVPGGACPYAALYQGAVLPPPLIPCGSLELANALLPELPFHAGRLKPS